MKTKASITPLTTPQRFIVIILGLAFIAAGIYMVADVFNFGKGIGTAEGTIIALQNVVTTHRSGSKSLKHVTYRPVVEFTVGTKQYKFAASVASDLYEVGEAITVNYDPKNPSGSARLAGKKEMLMPAVSALCGVIAVLFGFFAPSKKS